MQIRAALKNPFILTILASVAVTAALALAWRYTPLAEAASPADVIGWTREYSGRWWSPLLIVLAHLVASFIMFPRPLLTIAAVVAFGLLQGFVYSLAGILVSAAAGYYLGRLMDRKKVERMAGPRLEPITRMLKKEGLVAVTLVRLLPVAPFTVESVVAGALRVKLWHLLLGTTLGMLPGMIGTTVLGDQLAAVLTEDRKLNAWIVVGAVATMAFLFWYTHRWYRKLEAAAG